MKKFLIGLGALLLLLVVAAALVPFLFKDKIKAAVDEQIAKSLNAKVQYDADQIGVTLLSSFPDLGVSLGELRVIGIDSFSRDTLAYIPKLAVDLNLMSVIRGEKMQINEVTLTEPRIHVVVLKSGKANWDIAKPDSAAPATPADTASNFQLGIKQWRVDNGQLTYDDRSIPFRMALAGLNHTGSGDFAQDVFDMKSKTTAERFSVAYDGAEYISNKKLDGDVTMAMDLANMAFTFKENTLKLNDFVTHFEGTIKMPTDAMDFDIKFNAPETDFKALLSLLPGMYTPQFKDVATTGKMQFDGYYKGRMDSVQMPGYGLNLKVVNATFKYPDLPREAKNINVDVTVDDADGVTDHVKVDLRKLHVDLGSDQIDAVAKINGLAPMQLDGNVKAKINLAEAMKVYPVAGLTLRGLLDVDATAKGTYSETQMPVVNAKMNLTDGYVKSKDFPAPIENLMVVSNIANATGKTDDTDVKIENFKMTLDGEPVSGRVYVKGIAKPVFDADLKGVIDLTKITKIFPLEGTTLAGRIAGEFAAAGRMVDIDAGQYEKVKASGAVKVNDLTYKSKDLPQGMTIKAANGAFNNEKITISGMQGTLGRSDFRADGVVSNYMGYALSKTHSPLLGTLTVSSNRFDVNEWMVDPASGASTAPATGTAKEAEGVVQVPADLNLTLNATAGQVLYDNLDLRDAKGQVVVKDRTVKLNDVAFNTLGGSFTMAGTYDARDLSKPGFDMNLGIKDLNFQQAYAAFNTIKTLAPAAKYLNGNFSTNLNLAGNLGQDMMPVMNTLRGKALVEVLKATVDQLPALQKLSSLTNLPSLKQMTLKDQKIGLDVSNGNVLVKPFEIKVPGDDVKMNFGGTSSLVGEMDFVSALDVPTGKVGQALSGKLSSLTGVSNLKAAERVTMNVKFGGTVTDPKVSLSGGSVKGAAKDLAKSIVDSKVNEGKAKLEEKRKQAEDSLRNMANRKAQELQAKAEAEAKKRLKDEASKRLQDSTTRKAADAVKNQAKDKLKGLFGK